jgi:hypothetical protein
MEITPSPNNTTTYLLLDPSGDALLPEGYREIRHESAFLCAAAEGAFLPSSSVGEKRLLIRGASLCRWVCAWATGRRIPLREIASPISRLSHIAPELPDAFLVQLRDRLGAKIHHLDSTTNITQLLMLLYPDGPCNEAPSETHAARYLLFLAEAQVSSSVSALLEIQTDIWRTERSDEATTTERAIYRVTDSTAANTRLREWLLGEVGAGVETESGLQGQRFPLPIPDHWLNQARTTWRAEATRSSGVILWNRLRRLALPNSLKTIAAEIAAQSLLLHPADLTNDLIRDLSSFVLGDMVSRLRQACPPPVPIILPETSTVAEATRWFESDYLPYRQWQVLFGKDSDAKTIERCNDAFARWCLTYYPVALSGGPGMGNLAIYKSQSLYARRNQTDKTVTLWVILDGLPYSDAMTLRQRLLTMEPRLSVTETVPVVAPLPTITRFAKPAIMNGVAPISAITGSSGADATTPQPNRPGSVLLQERDARSRATNAKPGDVFVLSLLEPDKTYHSVQDADTIRTNVDSQLTNVAVKIAAIVREIPDTFALRVCLSTDHGRLLGSAIPRQVAVPPGMVGEGRAAWRDAYGKEDGFEAEGYRKEDQGTVMLSGMRFGLPTDVAVLSQPNAFLMSNGTGGSVAFPHGGLFPEEVFIPWIELERDHALPVLFAQCEGKATSGATGMLTLIVENAGTTPVRAIRLQLQRSDNKAILGVVEIGEAIAPLQKATINRIVPSWPTPEDCGRLAGTLELSLPTGEPFECPVNCHLTAHALYTQTLSADDLEGF